MNRQAERLCTKVAGQYCGRETDICPLMAHCALDIICETAMGQTVNAQAGVLVTKNFPLSIVTCKEYEDGCRKGTNTVK
jgi:hypothetical protein